VVPRRSRPRPELQRDALGRLLEHHGADAVVQLARVVGPVAQEQLGAELGDALGLAVHGDVALQHHATQLLVLLARLDLQGRARVALEVSHLLGLRERP
jgi:hypothetical protein